MEGNSMQGPKDIIWAVNLDEMGTFAYYSNKGFPISTSDDICDRFTFWKPDTYNKQEHQAKHFNNHVDILKW